MFNVFRANIRNKIGNFINNNPYLHDSVNLHGCVIFTTTVTGAIMGGFIFVNDPHAKTHKDKIVNGVCGSMVGVVVGALIGGLSPVLIPTVIIGGTIGVASIGFNKLAEITRK
jgi:hypothetical protein